MNVVILVPRRNDGGHRDMLWEFAKAWWQRDYPDWPMYEGHDDRSKPFNRSMAINDAARRAGPDWDVAVIIDADVLSNKDAVLNAVDIASALNQMVIPHDERIMLTREGTTKVVNGYRGNWRAKGFQEKVWQDSVSCCVVVSHKLWDTAQGFDELFEGWGYEDTAFRITCESLTGKPMVRLSSELFHLWHPVGADTRAESPTYKANGVRVQRYRDARWKPDEIRVLLDEAALAVAGVELGPSTIPRILHRTVPAETSAEVEEWWRIQQSLHPGWRFHTYREPIDPENWPLTSDLWDKCQNGAQKAGLIRLEALYTHGGIYVDSDVRPVRSFEPLLHVEAFAGWEDEKVVPDAVLGTRANHPAFEEMIAQARAAIKAGRDAWGSGPGVTTSVLPDRPDVLLLPPGAFYPHHYLERDLAGTRNGDPWVFCEHMWHHSWGTDADKVRLAAKQRTHE